MKKKIMIFVLLFAMLVGMGVPEQAKAAMSSTDLFNNWCEDIGLPTTFQNPGVSTPFFNPLTYENFVVGYSSDEQRYKVIRIQSEGEIYVYSTTNYTYIKGSKHYNDFSGAKTSSSYWSVYSSNYDNLRDSTQMASGSGNLVGLDIVFSTVDVYTDSSCTEILFKKVVPPYTFDTWCADAGLSCSASSNESSSVIPFWYEPDSYNYIVRKTLTASSTSGVYQLTMLQRNSSSGYYPYYFEVNNLGYLGVAGAFSDTSAFTVRNFYYDADGNGWKLQDKFDVSDLPYDHTNVTFDENVVFIYSDTDIYADREASSIWQTASTEYYNVDIPEPEITRVPIGGGTTVGGNAEPGGLLDFLITLITLAWTKLFAVEVPVDGYMISFQQIVIYGALAGVLGWLFYRLFKKG